MLRSIVMFLLGGIALGCAVTRDPIKAGAACVQGQTAVCQCDNGATGARTCGSDRVWSVCNCGGLAGTGGTGGLAGTGGSGTGGFSGTGGTGGGTGGFSGTGGYSGTGGFSGTGGTGASQCPPGTFCFGVCVENATFAQPPCDSQGLCPRGGFCDVSNGTPLCVLFCQQ